MIVLDVVDVAETADRLEYDGILVMTTDGEAHAVIFPWCTAAGRRELVLEWALGRAERFRDGGPDVDGGWRVHPQDGSYQSWARPVELPLLDEAAQQELGDLDVVQPQQKPWVV